MGTKNSSIQDKFSSDINFAKSMQPYFKFAENYKIPPYSRMLEKASQHNQSRLKKITK